MDRIYRLVHTEHRLNIQYLPTVLRASREQQVSILSRSEGTVPTWRSVQPRFKHCVCR